MKSHILAIDQGTTGTTALVMTSDGRVLSRINCEFPQHFPQPGWVEHEPEQVWASVLEAATNAVSSAGLQARDIAAVGLTNQRETTLVWERSTGRSLGRAIVWQDRRTAPRCEELRRAGHASRVRRVTGLVLDPYFSATKLCWILEHTPDGHRRAREGELCFGTIDSYLVWRLAGGERAAAPHVTDVTNASRTLLMDLEKLDWSTEMCEMHGVPSAILPRIQASAGLFARTRGFPAVLDGTPISGIAGDQHAALFGQGCFQSGDAKCTYGTGAFALVNTGTQRRGSQHGLIETVAWQVGDETRYALEGSCFVAGAAVQWLRDGLKLIRSSSEIEDLASSVSSSEGVVFVPALAGLGAPHWDADARGILCGLTRGTTAGHIARATLEGIAFQVDDLLRAFRADLGEPIAQLRVDGGAAANNLLMQFQANLSGVPVERPADLETTARGAAMLAGLGVGIFSSSEEAGGMIQGERRFDVSIGEAERTTHRQRWDNAVLRARSQRAGSL
jgi:glycerol kinase